MAENDYITNQLKLLQSQFPEFVWDPNLFPRSPSDYVDPSKRSIQYEMLVDSEYGPPPSKHPMNSNVHPGGMESEMTMDWNNSQQQQQPVPVPVPCIVEPENQLVIMNKYKKRKCTHLDEGYDMHAIQLELRNPSVSESGESEISNSMIFPQRQIMNDVTIHQQELEKYWKWRESQSLSVVRCIKNDVEENVPTTSFNNNFEENIEEIIVDNPNGVPISMCMEGDHGDKFYLPD